MSGSAGLANPVNGGGRRPKSSDQKKESSYQAAATFKMPVHYPSYKKADYETMPEWELDHLLTQYGLPLYGDLSNKRKFAMGAFLWPTYNSAAEDNDQKKKSSYHAAATFKMPVHYPRYKKADYETMPEWELDHLLTQYGLPLYGDLSNKRKFAMGAFLWPTYDSA